MNSKTETLAFVRENPDFFKKPAEWFENNWHIVDEFTQTSLALIEKGRTHYSARTIVEVMVHNSMLKEKGGEFKIGNDNAPDLARIFVVQFPQHLNFWEYRRKDHKDFKGKITETFLIYA